jgi:SAM-dependent methyltransferase
MQPRFGPRRGERSPRVDLGANGLDDRLGPGSDGLLGKSIMALDDRARWDEKHAAEHVTQKPSSLLKEIFEADSWPLPKGRALDIATGTGRNAIFLAERAFQVVGIDISPVALEMARRTAQKKSLAIDWQEADLERIELSKGYYDLVVNFNYLLAAVSGAANQKDAQAPRMGDLRDLFDRSIEDRPSDKP